MKKILESPYAIVAKELNIPKEMLDENSAMGKTPNWDSLNHMAIITELERNYGVTIPNSDIEIYATMNAIIELYDRESGNVTLRKRFVNWFKASRIGKIFYK